MSVLWFCVEGGIKEKEPLNGGKECINCPNVAAARCLLKRPFYESDNVSQESLPKRSDNFTQGLWVYAIAFYSVCGPLVAEKLVNMLLDF